MKHTGMSSIPTLYFCNTIRDPVVYDCMIGMQIIAIHFKFCIPYLCLHEHQRVISKGVMHVSKFSGGHACSQTPYSDIHNYVGS